MRDKFCCNNWLAQVPSIIQSKELELGKIEPAYLVDPILEMLHNIGYYCPVCGENLSAVPPRKDALPPVKPSRVQGCPACGGKGFTESEEVRNMCKNCTGTGRVFKPKEKQEDVES